jgi:uncharacterized protein (DUF4415 family)
MESMPTSQSRATSLRRAEKVDLAACVNGRDRKGAEPSTARGKPGSAVMLVAAVCARNTLARDVLEHFQEAGPGWQERINEALRKAAGKLGSIGSNVT